MVLQLTKQFDFQMAHALCGYDGKCRNIHGHNYRLFVTVEGAPITSADSAKRGMVIDFGDIKRIVEEHIVAPFDHALVLPADTPFPTNLDTKTLVVDFQPTCENLLLHFANLLEGHFPEGVHLACLRLHETETSYAELIL